MDSPALAEEQVITIKKTRNSAPLPFLSTPMPSISGLPPVLTASELLPNTENQQQISHQFLWYRIILHCVCELQLTASGNHDKLPIRKKKYGHLTLEIILNYSCFCVQRLFHKSATSYLIYTVFAGNARYGNPPICRNYCTWNNSIDRRCSLLTALCLSSNAIHIEHTQAAKHYSIQTEWQYSNSDDNCNTIQSQHCGV